MARSKFKSEKRQKELARKKKKEEKQKRKLEMKTADPEDRPGTEEKGDGVDDPDSGGGPPS